MTTTDTRVTIDSVSPGDQEVVKQLRNQLEAHNCPEHKLYTDLYLANVLKDRSFEYTLEKLVNAITWRRGYGQLSLEQLSSRVAVEALEWRGPDPQGRPILFVRPHLQHWSNLDTDAEIRFHMYRVEEGIAKMPPHVTQFVVVVDASEFNTKMLNLSFVKGLTEMMTSGYPDRLADLYIAPTNMAIRAIFYMVSPLLPKTIRSKIHLEKNLHDGDLLTAHPHQARQPRRE
ncbi:hypothetical protein PROFUN_02231 [Planoprotostelium fungivorum]|uniref:CRAL-TRIO domain-containing protein n=1 Tax=Planoprotostelium fungivorum TaxID=1890364 RepID=A0A2P6NYB8_9EUKA|nr:hypothetical protein PROFUN_02231 [Planoprotostelium fungivorum]